MSTEVIEMKWPIVPPHHQYLEYRGANIATLEHVKAVCHITVFIYQEPCKKPAKALHTPRAMGGICQQWCSQYTTFGCCVDAWLC